MFVISSSHFFPFPSPPSPYPLRTRTELSGCWLGMTQSVLWSRAKHGGKSWAGTWGFWVVLESLSLESRVSRAFVRRTRNVFVYDMYGMCGMYWGAGGGWIGDVLYSSFISVPFLLWTLMNGWMWGWLVLVLILVFAPCWESGLNFDSWVGVCGFDDYTFQLHLQQALIGETGLHNACVYHSLLSMPHWQLHRRCLFVQGKITSYISQVLY